MEHFHENRKALLERRCISVLLDAGDVFYLLSVLSFLWPPLVCLWYFFFRLCRLICVVPLYVIASPRACVFSRLAHCTHVDFRGNFRHGEGHFCTFTRCVFCCSCWQKRFREIWILSYSCIVQVILHMARMRHEVPKYTDIFALFIVMCVAVAGGKYDFGRSEFEATHASCKWYCTQHACEMRCENTAFLYFYSLRLLL